MKSEFVGYDKHDSGNTVESRGQTGFQSPCNDYIEEVISLDRMFVRDAASTFFARMTGQAMIGDGIEPGDVLMIDKAGRVDNGCIVLCYYEGEFQVRRIEKSTDRVTLLSSNPKYPAKVFQPGEDLLVWGVVTSVHRKVK